MTCDTFKRFYCLAANDFYDEVTKTYRPTKRFLVDIPSFKKASYGKWSTYLNLQTRDSDQNIINYQLVFDIDNDDEDKSLFDARHLYLKLLKIFPTDSIKIFFSGNRGYHITIYTPLIWANDEVIILHKIWTLVAKDYKKMYPSVDKSIYKGGEGGLFRCENTRHRKTGLYKIRLLPDFFLSKSIRDIRSLAKKPRIVKVVENKDNESHIRMLFNEYYEKYLANQAAEKLKLELAPKTDIENTIDENKKIWLQKVIETDTYTKYICPSCGDATFFRYKKDVKSDYLRCSHSIHCDYHIHKNLTKEKE